MSDTNHSSRSISFEVASQLKDAGYQAARVAGPHRRFDLIAWKGNEILFLVIKRSRNRGISMFSKEVNNLVYQIREGGIPGTVQLWIYRSKNWLRYRIMPGGAVPFEWGGA